LLKKVSFSQNQFKFLYAMTKRFLLITMVTAILILSSCLRSFICIHGNGNVVSEYRTPGLFSKISNSTNVDVIFRISDTTGVTVEAEENLIGYIETELHNGTLEIGLRHGIACLNFNEPARIIVTAPSVSEIALSGSGKIIAGSLTGGFVSVKLSGSGAITVEGVTADDMDVRISGSGDIQLRSIETSSIDARISGSGDMNLEGDAAVANFTTSGSGDNHSQNLLVKTAVITISGSGNIYTSVETRLNASISGSGNIYLKGNPRIYENVSGSGRIIEY
jgi:hypothetical protein